MQDEDAFPRLDSNHNFRKIVYRSEEDEVTLELCGGTLIVNLYPNPRQELIALFRGFIAVPVIAELDKLGLVEVLMRESFKSSDLSGITNPRHRHSVIEYLVSIGLVRHSNDAEDKFCVTSLGNTVLKRSGTAQIMYSYREMLTSLDQILSSEFFPAPECDRAMNVKGSGKTHGAKFFDPAIENMREWRLVELLDVSAGDGNFLARAVKELGLKNVLVNDLSPVAVKIATTSVEMNSSAAVQVKNCVGDARDVHNWSQKLVNLQEPRGFGIGVAIWFLLHEIAQDGVGAIRSFLEDIRRALPGARLIVGELFRLNPSELSNGRHESILPEFYFFHDFSGQAILSQSELETAFAEAGYSLDFFIGVDPINNNMFSAGTYGLSPIRV